MKKCHLCQGNLSYFRKIDTANLYQCKKCRLITISNPKRQSKKLKKLYSYKNYLKESKRLGKKLKIYTTIVAKIFNNLRVKRILDVGCGYGLFSKLLYDKLDKKMKKIEKRKFQLDVIEPEQQPYLLKKTPHKLHRTTFEKFLKINRKKYGLIIMMDVLEHFNNPSENLKRTAKILTKNGYLVIQTPNYRSLMAKICKNWAWWMPEDHKYIFSVDSLKKILKKDYKIEYLHTYEDLYSFKKNFDGNFTEIKSGFARKTIKAIVYGLFFPLYLLFRPILWYLGYGGLIFLVAKKRYNSS